MYKNILIPLDCSEIDQKIIEHIGSLCECMNPKISLLRVLHIHTRDAMNYSENETKKYMEVISRYFEEKNIEVESYIEFGDPEKVIIDKAAELECDLIAFAGHGHKTIMDFVLGSVIERVRHNVRIPILIINAAT
jgi:manganese transport protein